MTPSLMALQPGARLGPYEILAPIGAGGMGEVYRARDPRLGREVAIKVLPHDRVADESRRQRFIQEAKAASALNHPHIVTIHEIESADGIDFLVMEYVRGKSLEALIPRQGMRLGEALRIAIAVADAMAAAHARGIVHRDLKPANVMVGTDGAVKVLDFGLAKLRDTGSTPEGETQTQLADPGLSASGMIAGTAAYMSPEQASGEPVDVRSDIFSFGAMLYEMVTGARAFVGKTVADTLGAVLQAQPKPASAIVPAVPEDLEKLIVRCLRKAPQRRYQHFDDVRVALEDIKEESGSGTSATVGPVRSRRSGILVAVAATALAVAVTAWLLLRPRESAKVTALSVVPLTTLTGEEYDVTFSPDGEQVAFSWDGAQQNKRHIYVTLIGSTEVRQLTNDSARDVHPVWSPDGRHIAFLRERPESTTIQLVSAVGGVDRKVSDFLDADSLAWSRDGLWLAVGRSAGDGRTTGQRGIYLVPLDGSAPRMVVASKPTIADSQPAFSPDGHRLAYTSCNYSEMFGTGAGDCDVFVVDLTTTPAPAAPPRRLTTQHSLLVNSPVWTRDGSAIVYSRFAGPWLSYLWRVDVDSGQPPERIEVAGSGATGPALAASGDRLAFTRVSLDSDIYRFESGRPPQRVFGSTFFEQEPRLSPDGRRLVFASARAGGDTSEIWVAEADGSKPRQLTEHGLHRGSPSWSPDGRRIAYDSVDDQGHFHIWIVDADGGVPHQLATNVSDNAVPLWSHDGRWIYFFGLGTSRGIWRAPASGGPAERVTLGSAGAFACESPDGEQLLYQTKDADSPLMIMPVAGGDARQIVQCVQQGAFGASAEGVYYVPCDPNVTRPRWPRAGTAQSVDAPVHLLNLKTLRDQRVGTLEGLLDRPIGLSVSPDGKTIVYPRQVLGTADLMLIENFR